MEADRIAYFVPTALATIIASGVSIYTALSTAHERQQEYNAKFEQLVTDKSIFDAFGGYYVPEPGESAYEIRKDKAAHDQSVLEQNATTTLLSLQSVAESERQRRTVLLIGARLLNADATHAATGADAARLLEVLIDEADMGRSSWNPSEANLNSRLWRTIESDSFKDLVTAGYANDYYNDYGGEDTRLDWPTLNGTRRSVTTRSSKFFLPAHVVADQKPAKPDPLVGLVHFWAHVKATKGDENCLATI